MEREHVDRKEALAATMIEDRFGKVLLVLQLMVVEMEPPS